MVVKASIDLLLVFVNYTDPNDTANGSSIMGRVSPDSPDSVPPNALLFKDAVEELSDQLGITPWTHLLGIFGEKSVADQEIMAKAMSLINKVCWGWSEGFTDFYIRIVHEGLGGKCLCNS